jgi:hypothetical protein
VNVRAEIDQKPKRFVPDIRLEAQQRYSVTEAAGLLRQSLRKTWADIKLGRLSTVRDGRRVYVTGESIISRSTVASAA